MIQLTGGDKGQSTSTTISSVSCNALSRHSSSDESSFLDSKSRYPKSSEYTFRESGSKETNLKETLSRVPSVKRPCEASDDSYPTVKKKRLEKEKLPKKKSKQDSNLSSYPWLNISNSYPEGQLGSTIHLNNAVSQNIKSLQFSTV